MSTTVSIPKALQPPVHPLPRRQLSLLRFCFLDPTASHLAGHECRRRHEQLPLDDLHRVSWAMLCGLASLLNWRVYGGRLPANCFAISPMPFSGNVFSPLANIFMTNSKSRELTLRSLSKKMPPKNGRKKRSIIADENPNVYITHLIKSEMEGAMNSESLKGCRFIVGKDVTIGLIRKQ